MSGPRNIDIVVYHAGCRPNDEYGYQIDPAEANTLDAWIGWVLHLCEKVWFSKYELERMLRFWYTAQGRQAPR